MQKAEAQHQQSHNQPAATQRKGAGVESPQGEQIAQLEARAASSPQAAGLAQLAATADASPQATAQRRMMEMIHGSARMAAQRQVLAAMQNGSDAAAQRAEADEPLEPKVAQRAEATPRPNNTGLPDNLKSGIEKMSGISMDAVRVHYNSSQPAQLNAHAYAQGTDIHVAPGQERHLPHEAWHVVQQAQGRVRPTMQMKGDVPVNDDAGLEHEADVMSERVHIGHDGREGADQAGREQPRGERERNSHIVPHTAMITQRTKKRNAQTSTRASPTDPERRGNTRAIVNAVNAVIAYRQIAGGDANCGDNGIAGGAANPIEINPYNATFSGEGTKANPYTVSTIFNTKEMKVGNWSYYVVRSRSTPGYTFHWEYANAAPILVHVSMNR